VAERYTEKTPSQWGIANSELLRFVIGSSSEGLILLNENRRIADANSAAAEMLGVSVENLRGMDPFDAQWQLLDMDGDPIPTAERPPILASLREGARQIATIGVRRPKGKETQWLEIGAVPNGLAVAGNPSWFLITLKDISERKRAQDKLSEKVRILKEIKDYMIKLADTSLEEMPAFIVRASKNIFGASVAAIADYDAEKGMLALGAISWSEEQERKAREFLDGKTPEEFLVPLDAESLSRMMGMQIGVASNLNELSFGVIPPGISEKVNASLGIGWLRGLALASRNELLGGLAIAGEVGRGAPETDELSVFAEVTANGIVRKRAEERVNGLLEEKELILHEVHHRIKNNMSTMISLLSIQSRALKQGEAYDAIQDAISRLQSMNTLYDKLFRSEDLREMSLREYLPVLVREIVGIFPNKNEITIEESIDDVRLDIKKLSNLGILVNEIVTNTMKYGFPEGKPGTLFLTARLEGELVTLEVGDDGVGMPDSVDFESFSGFGLSLIRILAKQMNASVSVENRKGTFFLISFAQA